MENFVRVTGEIGEDFRLVMQIVDARGGETRRHFSAVRRLKQHRHPNANTIGIYSMTVKFIKYTELNVPECEMKREGSRKKKV